MQTDQYEILNFISTLLETEANHVTVSPVQVGSSLIKSGLIDSFKVIEIVVFLEKRYAIKFSSDSITLENFDTVGAMVALVAKETLRKGKVRSEGK